MRWTSGVYIVSAIIRRQNGNDVDLHCDGLLTQFVALISDYLKLRMGQKVSRDRKLFAIL